MSSLNKVMLIGRFGKDPEVKYTPSGMAVCSIGLATEFKTKEEKVTEWHNVVFWDKLAEVVGKYTEKGSLVYVEGRMRTRKYDKDGVTHYATEVVAATMQMLSFKEDRDDRGSSDNRPRTASGSNKPPARPQSKSGTGFDDMEDDIPF